MIALKCPACGAKLAEASASDCIYCGAVLAAAEAPVPAAASQTLSLSERFAAAERHPGFRQLQRHEPSSGPHLVQNAVGLVGGVVFAAIALALSSGFVNNEFFGLMRFMPLLFVAVGVGMVIFYLSRMTKLVSSPLERRTALIADKRTEVSGGGNSDARTRYFVTLEFKDGRREEYDVSGDLTGQVASGDVGVAYLKGQTVLDFRRLQV
jgi:hypothetical protein